MRKVAGMGPTLQKPASHCVRSLLSGRRTPSPRFRAQWVPLIGDEAAEIRWRVNRQGSIAMVAACTALVGGGAVLTVPPIWFFLVLLVDIGLWGVFAFSIHVLHRLRRETQEAANQFYGLASDDPHPVDSSDLIMVRAWIKTWAPGAPLRERFNENERRKSS